MTHPADVGGGWEADAGRLAWTCTATWCRKCLASFDTSIFSIHSLKNNISVVAFNTLTLFASTSKRRILGSYYFVVNVYDLNYGTNSCFAEVATAWLHFHFYSLIPFLFVFLNTHLEWIMRFKVEILPLFVLQSLPGSVMWRQSSMFGLCWKKNQLWTWILTAWAN